jgi:EpsI family protein
MGGAILDAKNGMKRDRGSWIRFAATVVLLLGAESYLRTRSQAEVVPPRKQVDAFPKQVGEWQDLKDVELTPDTREILGDGDFLSRVYGRKPDEPVIDFFLAYFPTQRTGSTMHSPQHCLPGAGWTPTVHTRVQVTGPYGPQAVNLYVISKGTDREVVLYWYQAHGRIVASEYWAKIYLVSDAISMNRSDGALLRVITRVTGDESLESATARAREFTEQALGVLDQYVPR